MASDRVILFIGVTTGQSRIMHLFPRWAEALSIDATIEGVDLPLDASRDAYRAVVERIATDQEVIGAVITTHKMALFAACHDLLASLDRYAALCGEVNAIAKRGRGLVGLVTDPPAATRALGEMLGPSYWERHGADTLCLGAGGAAVSIALSLVAEVEDDGELRPRPDCPQRLIVVDTRKERVDHLLSVLAPLRAQTEIVAHCHDQAERNDALLAGLAAGSLVINATGMGKDRPGSPITDEATFPERAVVWDLNYRGSLDFLRQARRQEASRQLQIHDGWRLFLRGWALALSPILQIDLSGPVFAELVLLARHLRVEAIPRH